MTVTATDRAIRSPSADELVARAEAMIPALAGRAPAQDRSRCIAPETIAEIKAAGLMRVLQPARWGGYEMTFADFADIGMALGRGDLCTGWVYGVYAGHCFHLGFYDDRAQADVWSHDQDAIIASSYAPGGKAEPVAGGYRFSGHWRFSSGSNDSDWVMVGGFSSDEPTELKSFLVPRADYQVIDTWNVLGLQGTGSNDVKIDDVFVPAHRVYRFSDGFRGTRPSSQTALIYRVPPLQGFYRGLTNASIGALEALLDEFIAYAPKKTGQLGPMSMDPDAQLACGQARVAIAEMKLILRATSETLLDYAGRGEFPSMEERLLFRYQAGEVAERCVNAARLVFEAAGGSVLFDHLPMGRIYRNLIAARQHVGVQHRAFGRALGANLFGLPSPEIML